MSTTARARILLPMECAADERRLAAFVLHNVDLAPQGPLNLVRIHPKCRPHTLSRRQVDARFIPTLAIKCVRCDQPGLILLGSARLIDRCELEITAGYGHLTGPVVLLFVVKTILTIERRPIRRI